MVDEPLTQKEILTLIEELLEQQDNELASIRHRQPYEVDDNMAEQSMRDFCIGQLHNMSKKNGSIASLDLLRIRIIKAAERKAKGLQYLNDVSKQEFRRVQEGLEQ
jgi:hypothetical protein